MPAESSPSNSRSCHCRTTSAAATDSTPHVIENGLLDAFVVTQTGGNAPLFDKIFAGLTVPGLGGNVNGTTIRGSGLVRNANSGLQGALTSNNVGSLAAFLETMNQLTGVNAAC